MSAANPTVSPAKSPVTACAKVWSALTKKQLKYGGEFSNIEWIQNMREFIAAVKAEPHCLDPRGRATSCACMSSLIFDDINDCAIYLVDFAQKKKDYRQELVLGWMKYAGVMKKQLGGGNNARVYLLPGCSATLVCSNACARLVGFGWKAWTTVKKAYGSGDTPCHGHRGSTSNHWNKATDDLLHDFFIKLEGLAAPRATRIVRDVVGDMVKVSLREDGDDIELPTYYTKRSLYKQLGADCKWELASSSTGNISKKKLDGCTVEQLPSWRTFTRFWKRYYPHVHISKPNEDIGEDCHKFVNY